MTYDYVEQRIDFDDPEYNTFVQYVMADVKLSRDAFIDPAKRQLVIRDLFEINLENE